MSSERVRRWLGAVAAVAALAALTCVVAAPAAQAAPCSTRAQTVDQRKGISCSSAKRVVKRVAEAARAGGAEIPECRGELQLEFFGWKVTPAPVGGIGIGTKYRKGRQSFRVSGGGTC
jgi:hypothetical protein